MTALVAVPSRGRLRDASMALLDHAGYHAGAAGVRRSPGQGSVELIEMRPADAAAWLAAGRLAGAFISTDSALEHGVDTWPTTELGSARSELVVACRRDAPYQRIEDLDGADVASHLPRLSARVFAARSTPVSIIPMGGALEGVCAAGLADAIVDLHETGASLARHGLRILEVVESCQGIFVGHPEQMDRIADLVVRLQAALAARERRYLVLHIAADRVDQLAGLFPGLASPTVLPLAGRQDLVAVHLVIDESILWQRLGALRDIGASGIVALPADAIVL